MVRTRASEPKVQGRRAGSDSEMSSGRRVPEPHDAVAMHLADGGLILLRRYGNPDGPRLVSKAGLLSRQGRKC